MTDPDFADATYIEPITSASLEEIIKIERPDAVLPTLGGQTALNAAIKLDAEGILAKYGRRAHRREGRRDPAREDRQLFKELVLESGADVAPLAHRPHPRGSQGRSRRTSANRSSSDRPHDGWSRLRLRLQRGRNSSASSATACSRPPRRGPARGVDPRLEGVRARAHAGQLRQHRRHLLDRERRPSACTRATRSPSPPALTLTDREYQNMRNIGIDIIRRVGVDTGGCNIQFAVDPSNGRAYRHRDEPACVPLPRRSRRRRRASDRQDRREARHRVPPRRDRERHHPRDPGELRADARLRRREDPAVRVREVPGRRRDPHHDDEERRRGDGHRQELRDGAAEVAPFPREARVELPLGHPARPSSTRTRCSRRAKTPTDGRIVTVQQALVAGATATRSSRPRRSTVVHRPDRPHQRGRGRGGGSGDARRRHDALGEGARLQRRPDRVAARHLRAGGPRRAARRRHPPRLQDRRQLRRRVPGPHAVHTTRRTTTRPRSRRATGRRSSSSGSGPTASARASSSTTRACTRPSR